MSEKKSIDEQATLVNVLKELGALRKEIEELKKKHNEALSMFVPKNEYVSSIQSINNVFTKLSHDLDKVCANLKKFDSDLSVLNGKLSTQNSSLQSFSEEIGVSKKASQKNQEESEYKIGRLEDYLKHQVKSLEEALNKKVNDFISRPSELKGIRDELLNKIANSSMDSQNANLRSTNTDKQLQLQERKIENIYLLLKKYELTK